MREILFRGKRKDTREWVFGMAWIFKDRTMICPWHEGMCKYDTGYYPVEVVKRTFGQFTGLRDGKDTKIFEGDLVQARFKNNHALQTFRVIFRYGEFLFDNGCVQVSNEHICKKRVIGNIHDNPELLRD